MKVRFINFERTKLPEEILKHNLEEKRKYFLDVNLENEKSEAEVQVNYNSLLSLSLTHTTLRLLYEDIFACSN